MTYKAHIKGSDMKYCEKMEVKHMKMINRGVLLRALVNKLYSMPIVGEWFQQMSYERNVGKMVEHNSPYITDEERAAELGRVYRQKIGRELNLENPVSYTEKCNGVNFMIVRKLRVCSQISML